MRGACGGGGSGAKGDVRSRMGRELGGDVVVDGRFN